MSRNPSLETALRHLKLPAFGQHYGRLADEAAAVNLSYDRYLQALAEQELAQRDLARQRCRLGSQLRGYLWLHVSDVFRRIEL